MGKIFSWKLMLSALKLGYRRKNVTQIWQNDKHWKSATSIVMKKTKQIVEEMYVYNKDSTKYILIKYIFM